MRSLRLKFKRLKAIKGYYYLISFLCQVDQKKVFMTLAMVSVSQGIIVTVSALSELIHKKPEQYYKKLRIYCHLIWDFYGKEINIDPINFTFSRRKLVRLE